MKQRSQESFAGAAREAVTRQYLAADESSGQTVDAGGGLLAALVAHDGDTELARLVLQRWLAGLQRGFSGYGLLTGGLAGGIAGLMCAEKVEPKLAGLVATTRSRLESWALSNPWRTSAVDWPDYDLLSGPAGLAVLLPMMGSTVIAPVLVEHFTALTSGNLDRLRVGVPHPGEARGANFGKVNTGLAHGLAGVITAMTQLLRQGHQAALAPGLARATDWLVERCERNEHGIACWPAFGQWDELPTNRTTPQAWCYGTPGIAWALWDAGDQLQNRSLCDFATAAMDSLARRWDSDRYLDRQTGGSHLAICHGAAGVLLIADAFARHAALDSAIALRDELYEYLVNRAAEISELAAVNVSMLTGATGVVAALAAVEDGPQPWLSLVGVR